MRFFSILLLSYIFFPTFSFAEIIAFKSKENPTECNDYNIQITGEITALDVKKFQNIISDIKNNKKVFWMEGYCGVQLDSRGGDINAAMEIGRIIRKNFMLTIVPFNFECSSACVLILGAGVAKSANGKVGVHRPYFESMNSNIPISEIRRKRDELIDDIKKYLNEMDISPVLMELMLGVPPEKIKYLSRSESTSLRLDGDDPSFNEKKTAEQARQYGLSSSVYRQREGEAWRKCKVYKSYMENESCKLSILLAIPIQVARLKVTKYGECSKPNALKEVLECMRRINLE